MSLPRISRPNHHPTVSFVVIAFNEVRNIGNCLRSILAQAGGHSLEVIVVDDASTDGTADLVQQITRDYPTVSLVRLPVNGGRGNARAVGVRHARGSFVAMVDADIVLPPEWLESCLESIHGVNAVGGKAIPDGDVAYLFRTFGLRARGRRSTMTINGNNGLYRRELFDVVTFDPNLTEGEDVALNHAIQRAGLRTSLVPNLTVSHCESKTFLQSLRWLYQSGTGAARQLETYRRVRLPDIAFTGQLLTLLVASRMVIHRRRALPLLIPLAWLSVVASGHMLACFHISRSDAARFLLATGVDAALIASYDVGRVVGHLGRGSRP